MFLKEFVRIIAFFLKKKRYKIKLRKEFTRIHPLRSEHNSDFFFGYYDKSPERNDKVIFHEISKDGQSVNIYIKDLNSETETLIANTKAFNWQMGARAIWINDDIISYNDFDGKKYICNWYSLSESKIIRTFDSPLQDYSNERQYYLSVNYRRLRSYAKEYAYNILPEMTETEFNDYDNDGIWMVDIQSGVFKLLLSISEVISLSKNAFPSNAKHFVNHIMINQNGSAFIFIHRYYVGKKRHDRLMFYDFKQLKCLMDGQMQSHYCWLNNENVFGYGQDGSLQGFYSINTLSGTKIVHTELNRVHPRDGHPTHFGDFILIDDYPDLSRMQSLYFYNINTNKGVIIGEFFHSLKNKGINRCDLHPRFSLDGKRAYVDTIYDGKRQLLALDIIS